MALKFTGTTTYLSRALSDTTSNHTLGGWIRKSSSNGIFATRFRPGNADSLFLSPVKFNGVDGLSFTPADGEWIYAAFTVGKKAYVWDATNGWRTLYDSYSGDSAGTSIWFGYSGSYSNYSPVDAELFCWRYWSGTSAAILNTTALESERLSETPVQTSQLVEHWPFDAADVLNGAYAGLDLTANGLSYTTTTNKPPAFAATAAPVFPPRNLGALLQM